MAVKDWSNEDCIYLAGVIDSRAIMYMKSRYNVVHNHLGYSINFNFFSGDKSVLRVLASLLGEEIRYYTDTRTTKSVMMTRIHVTDIKPIYEKCVPYMRSEYRKKLFLFLVRMRDTYPSDKRLYNKRNRIPIEVLKEREAIYNEYLEFVNEK